MADDRTITKKQWLEIAAVAFFVALIAYLMRLWMAGGYSSPSSDNSAVELGSPPSSSSVSPTDYTFPSIGIPNITLPGSQNGCCCDSGGCAVGSTEPTIVQFVSQGNDALSQIQQMSDETIQELAAIGNDTNNDIGGNNQFVIEGEPVA